jgi:hypothetical protein
MAAAFSSAGIAAVAVGPRGPAPRPQYTISFEIAHDTSAVGAARSSIAVGPDGVPSVSFYDGVAQDLMIAKRDGGGTCSDADWSCEVVDGSGTCGVQCDSGVHSSLVMTSADVLHVAWVNSTSSRLMYGTDPGTGMAKTAIATGGRYPSLAIDPLSGNPMIAYFNATNTDLYLATYLGAAGTGCLSSMWVCVRVEQQGGAGPPGTTGLYPSLAADPTGVPHISHYNQSSGLVRHATRVLAGGNCGSGLFLCADVEAADPNIAGTSIAMRPGGPSIAFIGSDAGNQVLRIAGWTGGGSATCGLSAVFDCDTIVDYGFAGSGPSAAMAVDDQGREHVAYVDTGLDVVSLASNATSGGGCTAAAWHCDIVVDLFQRPSAAIGPGGWGPVWMSMDDDNGRIVVARTVQNVPELSPAAAVPLFAALAVAAAWAAGARCPDRTGRIRSSC